MQLPICVDMYPHLRGFFNNEDDLPDPKNLRYNEGAVHSDKLWQQEEVLRIRFLNGESSLHELVEYYAREWLKYANLEFDFGDHPPTSSQIRISFEGHTYSSLIGTDAALVSNNQPTMFLGGFTTHMDEKEMKRVVLHEFGHALGCVHEQASPMSNIPWDKEKVFHYYKTFHGWSHQRTWNNVLFRYSENDVIYSEYDRESIMQYPVHKELTVGEFEIPWNSELSEHDKRLIAMIYPKGI